MKKVVTLFLIIFALFSLVNATVPADILNLTYWKLTLPINTDHAGNPDEILQPELSTYVNANYFFVNGSGNGVVFRAHCGGVTTSGSSYPRSELREMSQSDNTQNASWGTDDGKKHVMEIEQAITHLPVVKPHVVAGQIHDANDDVIVIRLESTKLFIDINGTDGPTLNSNYQLGNIFTVKFEVEDGEIRIYYNGSLAYTLEDQISGCYFKAGCYTQSNTDKGDAPDAYGEVIIYDLVVSHNTATNTPPTVSITSPVNGATYTAPASVTINATAADADGTVTSVAFYQGSTLLGTDTSSPYSYTWTNVSAGSYALTAKATDNGGSTTTSSVVNIAVNSGGSLTLTDNFDSGWGNFVSGGTKATRSTTQKHSGSYSARMINNESTSLITYANNVNLSGYSSATVSFWYYTTSFESGKDFFVQVSTNGGSSYTTVASYVSGTNFSNGSWYNAVVNLSSGQISGTFRLRFRNDAEDDSDMLYVDDVVLTAGGLAKPNPTIGFDSDALLEKSNLCQNYPNPFNSSTRINYIISEGGFISLQIFDIMGNRIKDLIVNKYETKGLYSVLWDARDNSSRLVPTGVYLYRIEVITENGSFSDTKRMVYIK